MVMVSRKAGDADNATELSRFPRSRQAPVGAWSPEEAARFAARRDYLFLKALLKDRAALAAAREEGLVHATDPHANGDACAACSTVECEQQRKRKPRKKTEARKAIEQAKLEAKHQQRRQQQQQQQPPTPDTHQECGGVLSGGCAVKDPPPTSRRAPADSASACQMEVEVGDRSRVQGRDASRGFHPAGAPSPPPRSGPLQTTGSRSYAHVTGGT